jgi:hypothetical protein
MQGSTFSVSCQVAARRRRKASWIARQSTVHRRDDDAREDFERDRASRPARAEEVARLVRLVQDGAAAGDAAERLRAEFGKEGQWLNDAAGRSDAA